MNIQSTEHMKEKSLTVILKDSIGEASTTALDIFAERTGIRVLNLPLSHPRAREVTTLMVPGYKQTQTYTCGFVAGLMVLHALYPKSSSLAFYRRVNPDPEMGTTIKKLLEALKLSGIGASVRRGMQFRDIQRHIDAGFPIITLVKTGEKDTTHWVVIYGYGNESGKNPPRVFVAGRQLFHQPAISWPRFCELQSPFGFGLVCWGRK
jgi:hypothetical protein